MLHIEIPTPDLLRGSVLSALFLVFCYLMPFNITPTLTEGFCIEEPPRITQGVIGPPAAPPKTVAPPRAKVTPSKRVVKTTPPKKVTPKEVTPKEVVSKKVHTDYQGVIWFLKSHEKFSPKAFDDYKQASYGFGSKAKYVGEKIDWNTASDIFVAEINVRYGKILRDYPNLQKDRAVALVLTNLFFNIGSPGKGLDKAIKNYDPQKIHTKKNLCTWVRKYVNAGGNPLKGLVRRRTEEVALIMAPHSKRQELYEGYRKMVIKERLKYLSAQ